MHCEKLNLPLKMTVNRIKSVQLRKQKQAKMI